MSTGWKKPRNVKPLTVIVKVPVPVFPAASVAEQVTVVVPKPKSDPDGGVQVADRGPSTTSRADSPPYVTVAPLMLVGPVVMFAGVVMAGAVVSWTITLNDALDVLPALSIAVHPTLVVPKTKVLPEVGEHRTATLPSTRSVAEAL